jgi:hypothetical protein
LAVFDVALRTAGGFIHRGFVPLTATGALESWGHSPSVRLRLTPLKMTECGEDEMLMQSKVVHQYQIFRKLLRDGWNSIAPP